MYRTLLHLIDFEKENTSLCGAVDARADDDLTSCECIKCLDALVKLTEDGKVEYSDREDWLDTIQRQRAEIMAADIEWEARNKA